MAIRVPLKQHPDHCCDCIEIYIENQVKYLQCPLVYRNSIVTVLKIFALTYFGAAIIEAVEIDISIDGYFYWRALTEPSVKIYMYHQLRALFYW